MSRRAVASDKIYFALRLVGGDRPGHGIAISHGRKPVFALYLGDATVPPGIGIIALAVSCVIVFGLSALLPSRSAGGLRHSRLIRR